MNETPSSPAVPVAETQPQHSHIKAAMRWMRTIFAVASTIGFVVVVVRTYDLEGQLVAVKQDLRQAETKQAELRGELDGAKKDYDALALKYIDLMYEVHPSVPPTNDKMFAVLAQGLSVTEDVYRTTNVGTTPDAAFATDVPAADRTDAFTQDLLIKNTHASQELCVLPIAWSSGGGATCALKCAAATITCSGAATDGWHVDPGATLSRRWDGTACVCVAGSAATTTYQSERSLR